MRTSEIRGFLRRQLRDVHDYMADGSPRRARRRAASPRTAIRTPRRGSSSGRPAPLGRRPARRPARATTISAASPPSGSAGSPAPAKPPARKRPIRGGRRRSAFEARRARLGRAEPRTSDARSFRGLGARSGSAPADPRSCCARIERGIVPGCGSGDDPGEASCHEGDTPRDVTLRLNHGPAVAAVAFLVARPCTRAWRPARCKLASL